MDSMKAINKNLVYLAENISNLSKLLLHLTQEEIISQNEGEDIKSEKTDLDKNSKLLSVLQKKDLHLNTFVALLRLTNNNKCAEKIEVLKVHKRILRNIWWPERRRLIKSLYKRKIGAKLFVEELQEIISRAENRMVVICESEAASKLTGLGGVGKTLTANWYAHEYEKEYEHVIWIDCGEGRLLTSFMKLARDLDVKHLDKLLDLDDYSRKSYETLEEFKCLWIFDNAEDYRGDEGIIKVLPKARENFYCLITSRSLEWGTENIGYGNISRFELNIFEENESVSFFKEYLKPEIQCTIPHLEKLCLQLGNLPLAMQLAVAALNRKKIDLQNYFEKTSVKDLENIVDTKFDDYEKTINASVNITFELMSKEEGGEIAKEILNIFGYIRTDEVDIFLIKHIFNHPSRLDKKLSFWEIDNAIELLATYSLITVTMQEKIVDKETEIDFTKSDDSGSESFHQETITFLSIHRLLQQVIRHNGRKSEKETLRMILNCQGFITYKLIPFTKYADEELRREFPKVKAELLDQQELVRLVREKRFDESVQLSKFMDEQKKTNITKFNYALCLERNGQISEARNLLEELSTESLKEGQKIYSVKMGVLQLLETVTKELVGGHLLVLNRKYVSSRRIQEILDKKEKFVIITSQESLNALLEILSSDLITCGYSLKCKLSTIDFQLLLERNKKRIEISDSSFYISLLPSTIEEISLKNAKVVISEEIELPNLKYLQLSHMSPSCLSHLRFNQLKEIDIWSLNSSLDLSVLPPTVQKLLLGITNVILSGGINFPNLKYLKLSHMSPSCLVFFRFVQLTEIDIWSLNSALDLSVFPSTVQNLFLGSTEIFVSGGIYLPNLKYLKSDGGFSCLFKFRVQPTQIDLLLRDEDFNVDMLPESVKCVKLRKYLPNNHNITVLTGEMRSLDKLVLEDFTIEEVEKMLNFFHPIELYIILNKSCVVQSSSTLIEMKKQIHTIAVGNTLFTNEFFENSVFFQHMDRLAKQFLLTENLVKSIDEKEFKNMCESFT